MASKADFFQYLATEHRIGMLGHIINAITTPLLSRYPLKLIYLIAGLHTEMANGFKGDLFCKNADVKLARTFNHLTGQISHLHGNRKFGGVFTHLKTGVNNTTVIPFFLSGG